MNGGHDADEEVEPNAIAGLQAYGDGFTPDAGNADLAVGLVDEGVVHVVRQLAVNADRLQAVQHGVAGSFEHKSPARPGGRPYGVWTVTRFTSILVTGSSPFT